MASLFQKLFSKDEIVDIEKTKDQSTLSFLRSQLDNSLFVRLIEKEGVTSDYIAFLQTSLQTKEEDDVELYEALHHLESYLKLHEASRTEPFFYKLVVKNVDDHLKDLKIAPFILLPLIQNALYYGYNSMEKYPVRIRVNIQSQMLKLEVSNRVNHHIENQELNVELRWFKERLHMLYPDTHTLLFNSNSSLFKATLFLHLK